MDGGRARAPIELSIRALGRDVGTLPQKPVTDDGSLAVGARSEQFDQ
jgi:hypothetical protein